MSCRFLKTSIGIAFKLKKVANAYLSRNGSSVRLGVRERAGNGVRDRVPVPTRAQVYIRARMRARLRLRLKSEFAFEVALELEFELASSPIHLPAFLSSVKETTAACKKTFAELNFHINLVRKLPFRNPKLVSK